MVEKINSRELTEDQRVQELEQQLSGNRGIKEAVSEMDITGDIDDIHAKLNIAESMSGIDFMRTGGKVPKSPEVSSQDKPKPVKLPEVASENENIPKETLKSTLPKETYRDIESNPSEVDKRTSIDKTSVKKVEDVTVPVDDTNEVSIADLLNGVTLDLDNIDIISEESSIEVADSSFNFIMNSKPTYQTVLNQSALSLHLESLTLADISNIANSTGDDYASALKRYQTFHNKVNVSSIGKLTFEEFLDLVTLTDIDSIQYGIMCATFPEDKDLSITCNNCENTMDNVLIPNDMIVSYGDDNDAIETRQEIVKLIDNKAELAKISMLNKTKRVSLPKSKIIINVKTPSLRDHLNLFASIEREVDNNEALEALLFISSALIPDVNYLKEHKKLRYVEIESLNKLYSIVKSISIEDFALLSKAVDEHSMKNVVNYKIEDVKCTNCQNHIRDISVNISELLFTETLQHLQ